MKRIPFLAAAPSFFLLIGVPVLAATRAMTLSQTIEYGLERSPSLERARHTEAIRGLESRNALSSLLPSLDLESSHGVEPQIHPSLGRTSISESSFGLLSLNLTMDLYDNGRKFTAMSIADLKAESSALEYLRDRDELILKITEEYHRFSLAVAVDSIQKEREALLRKQLEAASRQYRQGMKAKRDYLRFKTQVQRAEIDRLAIANQVDQSELTLREFIGAESGDELEFQPLQPPLPNQQIPELPLEAPGSEKFYDFRIAKFDTKVGEKEFSQARRNYWPEIHLSGGVSYSNEEYLRSQASFESTDQIGWKGEITLKYNLWDWGHRRRSVAIASVNRDIQESAAQLALHRTRSQIGQVMNDLRQSRASYLLSQELLANEVEGFAAVESEYRLGKIAYLDLITSLNDLLDARLRQYSAYFDVLTNLARYRFFEGTLHKAALGRD